MAAEPVDIEALAALGTTPGPWEPVLENDPRGQPVAYYRAIIGIMADKGGGGYLSVVASGGRTVRPSEWEPNARLIAAAPALLAELRALRAEREELRRRLKEAFDYIDDTGPLEEEEVADLHERLRQALASDPPR